MSQDNPRSKVDPAQNIPIAPPNLGRPVIPHIVTFNGILTSIAHSYRNPDEAIRHASQNAIIMRKDCAIMECLEARQRGVALLNWHLEPEDAHDEVQKRVADELTSIIKKTPRFMEYRRNLLEAVWCGRYAVQNVYGFDYSGGRRKVVIRDWRPIHGDKLVFRFDDGSGEYQDGQVGIRVSHAHLQKDLIAGDRKLEPTENGMGWFLQDWERKLLSLHRHYIEDAPFEDALSAGSIHGVGIRSRIYWTWFQKQEALAMLMEFLQRSAMGLWVYYYPAGNDEAESKMLDVAKNQADSNVILMPRTPGDPAMDGYGIERVECSPAGLQSLKEIVHDFFGAQIKRYILGQMLTTEAQATGLGSGVADLHQESYMQIVQYDSTNLEETLTKDLVRPLHQWNFPEHRDFEIRFAIDTKTTDADRKLQAVRMAWDMGAKIRNEDVMSIIGFSEPTEDEAFLQNPVMLQQARLWEQTHPGSNPGGTEPLNNTINPNAPREGDQPAPGEQEPGGANDELTDLFGPMLQDAQNNSADFLQRTAYSKQRSLFDELDTEDAPAQPETRHEPRHDDAIPADSSPLQHTGGGEHDVSGEPRDDAGRWTEEDEHGVKAFDGNAAMKAIEPFRHEIESMAHRASRRIGGQLDPDELANDCIASIWESYHNYDPQQGPPENYIRRAAWNYMTKAVGVKGKKSAQTKNMGEESDAHDALDPRAADPSDIVAERDSRPDEEGEATPEWLDGAIKRLPLNFRQLVQAKLRDSKPTNDELGAEFGGMTGQAVQQKLQKAYEMIRKMRDGGGDDAPSLFRFARQIHDDVVRVRYGGDSNRYPMQRMPAAPAPEPLPKFRQQQAVGVPNWESGPAPKAPEKFPAMKFAPPKVPSNIEGGPASLTNAIKSGVDKDAARKAMGLGGAEVGVPNWEGKPQTKKVGDTTYTATGLGKWKNAATGSEHSDADVEHHAHADMRGRHDFASKNLHGVDADVGGMFRAFHASPSYQKSGQYYTKDFAPQHAEKVYSKLKGAVGSDFGGGKVVDLSSHGEGWLGFSSPAGAMVLKPPKEPGGKWETSYTVMTGPVQRARAGQKQGASAAPQNQGSSPQVPSSATPPGGGPSKPGDPPVQGPPAVETPLPPKTTHQEKAVAAQAEREKARAAQAPIDAELVPQPAAPKPPERHEKLRTVADAMKQEHEAAVDKYTEAVNRGARGKALAPYEKAMKQSERAWKHADGAAKQFAAEAANRPHLQTRTEFEAQNPGQSHAPHVAKHADEHGEITVENARDNPDVTFSMAQKALKELQAKKERKWPGVKPDTSTTAHTSEPAPKEASPPDVNSQEFSEWLAARPKLLEKSEWRGEDDPKQSLHKQFVKEWSGGGGDAPRGHKAQPPVMLNLHGNSRERELSGAGRNTRIMFDDPWDHLAHSYTSKSGREFNSARNPHGFMGRGAASSGTRKEWAESEFNRLGLEHSELSGHGDKVRAYLKNWAKENPTGESVTVPSQGFRKKPAAPAPAQPESDTKTDVAPAKPVELSGPNKAKPKVKDEKKGSFAAEANQDEVKVSGGLGLKSMFSLHGIEPSHAARNRLMEEMGGDKTRIPDKSTLAQVMKKAKEHIDSGMGHREAFSAALADMPMVDKKEHAAKVEADERQARSEREAKAKEAAAAKKEKPKGESHAAQLAKERGVDHKALLATAKQVVASRGESEVNPDSVAARKEIRKFIVSGRNKGNLEWADMKKKIAQGADHAGLGLEGVLHDLHGNVDKDVLHAAGIVLPEKHEDVQDDPAILRRIVDILADKPPEGAGVNDPDVLEEAANWLEHGFRSHDEHEEGMRNMATAEEREALEAEVKRKHPEMWEALQEKRKKKGDQEESTPFSKRRRKSRR